MSDQFGIIIDFDIEKTLRNIAAIKAKIQSNEANNYAVKQVSLLKRDRHNRCQALPRSEAKSVIDHVWDNFGIIFLTILSIVKTANRLVTSWSKICN